jgi:regulatory protein
MKLDSEEIDEIIAHLIGSNFLNESRFFSFARGNTASNIGETNCK